ncbi:MAG TPA: hypothetical protein VEI57_04495 [Nitrospirota bacterium]|nr:hypothetical protein [Nitrospirota bacterium]
MITITSAQAKTIKIQYTLKQICRFLQALRKAAEQLTLPKRWRFILSRAFIKLPGVRTLQTPDLLLLAM